MKERVLRLLKKSGAEAKDYWKVWRLPTVYNSPLKRDGFCHEWNYYDWAGMSIHHNIETDKIELFCDNHHWFE